MGRHGKQTHKPYVVVAEMQTDTTNVLGNQAGRGPAPPPKIARLGSAEVPRKFCVKSLSG
jgi:hypothetical protein